MNTVLVWKEQFQNIYAKYSVHIEIGLKFVLGLLVFGLINTNVGFMEAASGILCTIGLSVVCAFLPMTVMLIAATALLLLHFYALSLAVVIVAAVVFVLLYIFFLRFSYKVWLVLLAAVLLGLKVPFVIPVAIGLLATPASILPVLCGTVAYYVVHYVKTSSSIFEAEGMNEIIEVTLTCATQIAANKEMWIMIAAIVICTLLVYGIRTRFFDHAWKIASVVGAVAAVIICTIGNIVMNVSMSYVMIVVSGVLAIAAGLLLEILFFAVDYSRTEHLEFEDDEYHYYVKAVPKYAVTAPEKSVKQIAKPESTEQSDAEKSQDAEEILLTRSLSKELGLNSTDME